MKHVVRILVGLSAVLAILAVLAIPSGIGYLIAGSIGALFAPFLCLMAVLFGAILWTVGDDILSP